MITWAEIKTDSKLIDSKFLLKAKFGNPTKMSLKDIIAYWNHWVSKNKGDLFSFGVDSNSDKGKVMRTMIKAKVVIVARILQRAIC